MGILSDIFAEFADAFSGSTQTRPSGGSATYGNDPFNHSKNQTSKNQSSVKNVPISQQKTALEMYSHKHPAKTSNTKTEKRPEYKGSLGAVNDEGCAVHARERYVSADIKNISASSITPAEMRKAVIMSEILGKPKSKR